MSTRILAAAGLSVALGAGALAWGADRVPDPEVPPCQPVPTLLHDKVLPLPESRTPHAGQVSLSYTTDQAGTVSDVRIEESTDSWLHETSIQSILRWRYAPPERTCRATTRLTFTTKD